MIICLRLGPVRVCSRLCLYAVVLFLGAQPSEGTYGSFAYCWAPGRGGWEPAQPTLAQPPSPGPSPLPLMSLTLRGKGSASHLYGSHREPAGSQCITGWQSRGRLCVISIHLSPTAPCQEAREARLVGGEGEGKMDGVGVGWGWGEGAQRPGWAQRGRRMGRGRGEKIGERRKTGRKGPQGRK